MSSVRRLLAGIFILGALGAASPALTPVRDVLYTANGTPLTGVVVITWPGFTAGDGSTIPANTLNVEVVDGNLRVDLIPTTNARTAVTYSVRIISNGKDQTTETWSVPPSTVPVAIQLLLVSSSPGGVIAPPGLSSGVQIGDVAGLSNQLTARPVAGPGYTASRAAIIDANGTISAATGAISDCVRVDGTAAPCTGTGSTSPAVFVDADVLTGVVDGANAHFSLRKAPNPGNSMMLARNGLVLQQGTDYTLVGSTVSFQSTAVPQPGDILQASYRAGTSSDPGDASGSTAVFADADNIYGAFTEDFGSATLRLPRISGGTPSSSGSILLDMASTNVKYSAGSATRTMATMEGANTFSGTNDFSGATAVRLNRPDIGATPLVVEYTAGVGGCTQYTLVKTGASDPTPLAGGTQGVAVVMTTSDTGGGLGIAQDTVAAGGICRVAEWGVSPLHVDSGGMAAGDMVLASGVAGGYAHDSGQSSSTLVASNIGIAGKALSAPSGGTIQVELRGPGHFGSGSMAAITGAIARTVQDKNRDVVSVKDFGAAGSAATTTTSGSISSGATSIPLTDGSSFAVRQGIAFYGSGATATAVQTGGNIITLTITAVGQNYTSAGAWLELVGGGGTYTGYTITVSGGVITAATISGATGYTSNPTVLFHSVATYVGQITAVGTNTATVTPATTMAFTSGALVKHDDTVALQAALSTGLSVYAPCGTYPWSSKLTINNISNITVYGAGRNCTFFKPDVLDNAMAYTGTTDYVEMHDFSVLGQNTTPQVAIVNDQDFIAILNGTNTGHGHCVWRNLEIAYFGAGIAISVGAGMSPTYGDNWFTDNSVHDIYGNSSGYAGYFSTEPRDKVMRNVFTGIWHHDVYFSDGVVGSILQGNTSNTNHFGAFNMNAYGSAGQPANASMMVNNNHCFTPQGFCISVSQYGIGIVIEGNTVNGAATPYPTGIIQLGGGANGPTSPPTATNNAISVSIINNTFLGTTGTGVHIYLINANYALVSNNNIECVGTCPATSYGIVSNTTGAGYTQTGNHFINNHIHGPQTSSLQGSASSQANMVFAFNDYDGPVSNICGATGGTNAQCFMNVGPGGPVSYAANMNFADLTSIPMLGTDSNGHLIPASLTGDATVYTNASTNDVLCAYGADPTFFGTGVLGTATVMTGADAFTGSGTWHTSGGGGTGAVGTFTVSGGNLATITITNGGSGYTSNPTFVVDTGGTLGTSTVAFSSCGNTSNSTATRQYFATTFTVPANLPQNRIYRLSGDLSEWSTATGPGRIFAAKTSAGTVTAATSTFASNNLSNLPAAFALRMHARDASGTIGTTITSFEAGGASENTTNNSLAQPKALGTGSYSILWGVSWTVTGLATATYTSGGSITGSAGQTCSAVSGWNNSLTSASATIALTGTNTITAGTAFTVNATGWAATAAPTQVTLSNGTATCSGTATISSTLGPAQGNAVAFRMLTVQQSN